MERILLAGSYGHGNLGDEAILCGMLTQLRARLPRTDFWVVAGDTKTVSEQFDVQTVSWASWRSIAAVIQSADLVIQGGGGQFFDYGEFDAAHLLQDAAPDLAHFGSLPLLAWLYNKPLMFYACGVGPLETSASRSLVRAVFTVADRATVRDDESRQLLDMIGVDSGSVEVTADPAFAMPLAEPSQAFALLAQYGIDPHRPIIAVTPRIWSDDTARDTWEAALSTALKRLAVQHAAQVVFIPLHAGQDEAVCRRLGQGMAAPDVYILGSHPPSLTARVIGCCDLVIGLRLHSLVFAIMTGAPAVALSYAPKVRSLLRQAGREDLCLEFGELARLPDRLTWAWTQREIIRRDFLAAYDRLKERADLNVEPVLDLLKVARTTAARPAVPASPALRDMLRQALLGRLADIDRMQAERPKPWQDPESSMDGSTEVARLNRIVQERDQTILGLQDELHTKVGRCNEVIQSLQAEMQTKVDECNLIIQALQTELHTKVAACNETIRLLHKELQAIREEKGL